MRNGDFSEPELIQTAAVALRERLPSSWQLEARSAPSPDTDAVLTIRAPDGTCASVILEVKRQLEPRDVPRLTAQLRQATNMTWSQNTVSMVVAPFVNRRAQQLLTEASVGYADSTGNLRLAVETPAIFIERSGASSNPWREDRPLQTLNGARSGRVVRAVCDFRPPFGIRELATRSVSSTPMVSRVVDLLDREALVTRSPKGSVLEVQWPALIRRWTQDYSLRSSNRTSTFLEPRGLPALLAKLRTSAFQYAVTGSLAASMQAPIAAPRLAAVFVENVEQTREALGLRPAEAGANVLMIHPFDPVVFDRCWERDGTRFAALSQVAADLLTSPGRGPSEGEELLRWMEAYEDAWRSA